MLISAVPLLHTPTGLKEATNMLVSSMAPSVYVLTLVRKGLVTRVNARINVQETVPSKGVEV